MALRIVRENILCRVRRCSAADNQFFLNCLQALEAEQENCISLIEQANLFLTAQMLSTQLCPHSPSDLKIPETFIFISDMFKDVEVARGHLATVQQKHAELLQQYAELEATINSVNTDGFPQRSRLTPALAAVVEDLSHLDKVIKKKEQDLRQNDRLRRLEQKDEDSFFPRLIFESPSELHRDESLTEELMLALARECASPVAPPHGLLSS
ncbi:hypothetical protein Emag_004634 [Eimeria magna]